MSPLSDEAYECLVEKGWPVSLKWDGGIEVTNHDVHESQLPQLEADERECWAPIYARIDALTDVQVAQVYGLELQTRDCLTSQGIEIESPPSEHVFVDTFHTAERWSAYSAARLDGAISSESQWRELSEACPQPAMSFGAEEK